jgi:hypothetical protein
MPAITTATPASCTAEGSSESRITPRMTEPTGCSVSVIAVSSAGRRGSDTEISIQPSTWEVSARVISQACDSRPGKKSMSPTISPAIAAAKVLVRVASNSGPRLVAASG